jgi:membrane-associated PAP2 superfamily phosphatase
MKQLALSRYALTIYLLTGLLAWDTSGLDMAMAHWFGGSNGFALHDNWLFTDVLHDGARLLSWCAAMWLTLGVWWPSGCLRRLDTQRRVQLAVTTVSGVLLISLMKSFSTTSCPWDLAAFGGVARHVSHWAWRSGPDGGGGRCFPAGHASSGFAFIGGYLVFRKVSPTIARRWLAVTLFAGFTLGLSQQMRGAHFMSHTLWTAWLCWSVALGFDVLWRFFAPEPSPASTKPSVTAPVSAVLHTPSTDPAEPLWVAQPADPGASTRH